MTRRILLLGTLGGIVSGCGGGGESASVSPSVWIDWGNAPTRTSPLRTVVHVPEGTQSVVVTFRNASASDLTPRADVVVRGTRPEIQGVLSNGLPYYGSTRLTPTQPILRGETQLLITCYETPNFTGRKLQSGSTATPLKNGEFHSLSEEFALVRFPVNGIHLEANATQLITIPVGGSLPITLNYFYANSIQEIYTPTASELEFVSSHPSHLQGPIALVRHLESSPDANGNPRFVLEGKAVGKVRYAAYADGIRSNEIEVTVVPAS